MCCVPGKCPSGQASAATFPADLKTETWFPPCQRGPVEGVLSAGITSSWHRHPQIILSLRQRFEKEVSLFDKDVDDEDNCP